MASQNLEKTVPVEVATQLLDVEQANPHHASSISQKNMRLLARNHIGSKLPTVRRSFVAAGELSGSQSNLLSMIKKDTSDNRRSIYGLANNKVASVPLLPQKTIKPALTTVTHEETGNSLAHSSKPAMHASIVDRPDIKSMYNMYVNRQHSSNNFAPKTSKNSAMRQSLTINRYGSQLQ